MAEPLKNHFDLPLIDLLAARFAEIDDRFDVDIFTATLVEGFPLSS